MGNIAEFLIEVNSEVDRALDALVPANDVEPRRLHEAVRWSLFAGGKRIRPAIVMAAGRAFGVSLDALVTTAAAIEMIHTYSLIHDDLPAMDNDDLRRGKPTCHKQFGDATAILAGDVLQTLAYKAIAEDERLPAEIRLELIKTITAASGTPDGMVAGQQLDLDAEGRTLSIDEIEKIHRRKTGALISAAAASGAIIGGASDEELSAVAKYADKLGLLFQVTDDLLDVTQSTEAIGKTAGKDAISEKATYPGHFGVERSLQIAKEFRDDACGALSPLEKDTSLLVELADLVLSRTR